MTTQKSALGNHSPDVNGHDWLRCESCNPELLMALAKRDQQPRTEAGRYMLHKVTEHTPMDVLASMICDIENESVR